jgi:hypothetical protein
LNPAASQVHYDGYEQHLAPFPGAASLLRTALAIELSRQLVQRAVTM